VKIVKKIYNYYKRNGLEKTFLKIFLVLGSKVGLVARPPYEYIQDDVENNLANYLNKSNMEIRHIAIVGAHYGDEVYRMMKLYPNCMFYLFEPVEKYFNHLSQKFRTTDKVKLFNCALSDKKGFQKLYETNIDGSQSILRPGRFAKEHYNINIDGECDVEIELLDNILPNTDIDCLWIDVQGAELQVLRGAKKSLPRINSVFIEVSIKESLYDEGAIMSDLNKFLDEHKLTLVGLGTDHRNLTGNAFFLKINDT
jgi:FkbM family methyltransferase